RPNRGKVACSAPPRPRRSGLRAVGSPVPDRVGGGPPRRAMRRLLLGAAWWSLAAAASAATLPAGFAETPIATGMASPTAMDFAPDGRLFVCEQTGSLRVIKNNALLATPFVTLDVDFSSERGLLG